ncbi:hypothetical protein [Bacillus sp. KH172YL63]|uniref:hypothetical protein n=1 Tax=Bacillus sp. KH172YL63 TaxID=2709784 RepID=UPI00156663F2|nr:hypothetical protein [Bacillus sp. KH172YL63]
MFFTNRVMAVSQHILRYYTIKLLTKPTNLIGLCIGQQRILFDGYPKQLVILHLLQ